MAAKGISCVKVQRNSRGFTAVLSSALCEWLLILLLFIHAVLSYLLMKFSQYCKLQTPCLLCSSLDHLLGNEKSEFYHSLLCGNHRSEVSSLIACQIHDKLADVHGMCEDCLFSSTSKNKSSSETHRLLVGKLGLDLESLGSQRPFPKKEFVLDSSDTRICSCCSKPWKARQMNQRLVHLRSSGAGFTKPDIPLHRMPARSHFNHRDSLKKLRDKVSVPTTSISPRNGPSDHLSHVGYTELKFTSDSESEFPLSDDDNAARLVHQKSDIKEQLAAWCAPERPRKSLSDDVAPAKLRHQASDPGPSLAGADVQTDVMEPRDKKSSDSGVSSGNGGPNLKRANWKSNPSVLSEFISHDDHLPSSNNMEVPSRAGVSTKKSANVTGTSENEHASATENAEAFKLTSTRIEEGSRTDQVLDVPSLSIPDNKLQTTDASSSDGIEKLQKSASVGRNETSIESPIGCTICEHQDENVFDPLKQHGEYEHKSMGDLIRELEEERNASAIAANQAMAMITRLQEEKAAFHMEALQYLRMMEEQAEYDVEALEKANDLLAEKEKDIQDLEYELEFYRNAFPDRPAMENMHNETSDLKRGENEDNMNIPSDITPIEVTFNGPANVKAPWLELFEDEKQYISQHLRKLEMEIQQFSSDGTSEDKPNGQYFAKLADGVNGEELNNEGTETNHEIEDNSLCAHKDLPICNGSSSPQEGSHASDGGTHFACEENNHSNPDGKECSNHHREVDLVVLEHEVSDLNTRLEALEADYNFLEHTYNVIRNGKEGLEFIQEVAHQLREIRKLIRKRSESVP